MVPRRSAPVEAGEPNEARVLDALAPPCGVIEDEDDPVSRTKRSVAVHIYEELVQHLGQMEITRDVIVARS